MPRSIAFAFAAFFSVTTVWAQAPAEVTLTRLDCGTGAKPVNIAERFSDTFAYGPEKQLPFTFSCYLIKHGNEYMVWDTGFVPGSVPNAPKVSLTDQLATLTATTRASSRRSRNRRSSSAREIGTRSPRPSPPRGSTPRLSRNGSVAAAAWSR